MMVLTAKGITRVIIIHHDGNMNTSTTFGKSFSDVKCQTHDEVKGKSQKISNISCCVLPKVQPTA